MIAERGLAPTTVWNRLGSLRKLLRFLWEYHGAPKLDSQVRRQAAPRPRNTVARAEEINAILRAAKPDLRLWLLLCSDLALRATTAANLGPDNYDAQKQTIRLTTKFRSRQTLPVTREIADLLRWCEGEGSFVRQLQMRCSHTKLKQTPDSLSNHMGKRFRALRLKLGITRKLTAHDLRRVLASCPIG
jgi:integrase